MNVNDCIFCKMVRGTIPVKPVYENELLIAINDINPQAPHHILIIPKNHIAKIEETDQNDKELLGEMVVAAAEIARKLGVTHGYRLVFNEGNDGGQTVDHIHLHLLAGRSFDWPPG